MLVCLLFLAFKIHIAVIRLTVVWGNRLHFPVTRCIISWTFCPACSLTVKHPAGPSSPIIENVNSVAGGLNISWRTDVTSRQERYVVLYTRNDTGEAVELQTRQAGAALADLHPGAGYRIQVAHSDNQHIETVPCQVYAVSHGLSSEPHDSFQAVPPLPPGRLAVLAVQGNNVSLAWQPPAPPSLYTEYILRYRPADSPAAWTEVTTELQFSSLLCSLQVAVEREASSATLTSLTPGTRLQIQLDSASHHVPSGRPVSVLQVLWPYLLSLRRFSSSGTLCNLYSLIQTLAPAAVSLSSLAPVLGAENVTLAWPALPGRVESFSLTWAPVQVYKHYKQ